VLTAAVLADEHGLTPFDAIHAGIAITTDGPILSSEQEYEELELNRVPLEPSNK
jgi:predicted nucleic acid-binding protein